MNYELYDNDTNIIVELKQINKKRDEQLAKYCALINDEVKKKTSSIVDELVAERKRQGLTQQDVANITGVAVSNITRFESKKTVPTFQFFEKYARALGKSMVYKIE